jgi:tRNA-dihydrouridine synthase
LRDCGFVEAITPFVSAMPGFDPMKDRELAGGCDKSGLKITPQFIGKDPQALKYCLQRIKDAGYDTADLNCGCPFPMVRNKGRGSGILKTPDVLRRMLEAGCEVMGDGKFSVKARLGVGDSNELSRLIPLINEFPLRFLTVHGRIAKQMYDGISDMEAVKKIAAVSRNRVVFNGDLDWRDGKDMVGRSFIRYLGERDDSTARLLDYVDASRKELCGDRPVLGRVKELVAYWKDAPHWRKIWPILKIARNLDELALALRS